MSVFEKRPGMALAAGALTLSAVAGTGLFALHLSGTTTVATSPASAEQTAVPVAKPEPVAAKIRDVPAEAALTEALEKAPKDWKTAGSVQRSATPPLPFSCTAGGSAPAVALSRQFRVDSERVQVVATAYTAGLGAEAMARLMDDADSCAGGGVAVRVGDFDGKKPGVEAHRVFTYEGFSSAQVVAFRRGDVVVFIAGSEGAPLSRLARELNGHLAGRLEGVCADQKSTVEDARRSPWSAAGYRPYTVNDTVSVRDLPLPRLAKGSEVEAVGLPGPKIKIERAKPAEEPIYPVWPPMPDKKAVPKPPASPDKAPVTQAKVAVLAEDETGPGCGWAFTGMSPVAFDAKAAGQDNEERRAKATEQLAAGTVRWQRDVLEYWEAYDGYVDDAAEYKDYAADVRKVNKAWDAIGEKWDEYWVAYDAYQAALGTRSQFFVDQDNARARYQNALDQCEADNREAAEEARKQAEEREKERDEDEKDEGEGEDSEEQQEPAPAPAPVDCEAAVAVPAILSYAPPPAPSEPAQPKDPRPANRR
ncbi:hypothetical protein D477_002466 [Arthrobacter crystallopoietes BAB-32]|uniref:Uncharacterized protein n=1 Tax=Arthrobacter crystallopoietes BAB-32 TaxID=1246476 RepID=N1V6P7_9MICC|nr:hypothetical protein [Arthrobacter crystallopoietes]EMY35767.1 hypothetical protein D477_002466 [Arthrobacter crystallopoietes BAB-32]